MVNIICCGLMYDKVDVYSVVWVVSLLKEKCIYFGELDKNDVIWILNVKLVEDVVIL